MAIVKHIKSRNANYSAAINYLLFEHDEKTGKKIVDESGRSILRKKFYMDGLNCDPMSFDKECELTNAHFHKNKKREDIKSHHYIISYDPADVTENGLTGEKAQAISLKLAKQMFPGYQALVVTHTDGHNESGNIHTHIVINSVRKTAVERQPYMDKPHEEAAGYKHRSTDKFMNTFKKTVMDRCQQEGLHQIDLLAPAEKKITPALRFDSFLKSVTYVLSDFGGITSSIAGMTNYNKIRFKRIKLISDFFQIIHHIL